MGTGSGILAIVAASKGASVVAVDINSEAVKCCKENARLNGVASLIDARDGNLFQPLQQGERFDVMFFNPPFFPEEPVNMSEYAWKSGSGHHFIIPFFQDAKRYLNEHGVIHVILSTDADISFFETIFAQQDFRFALVKEKRMLFETLRIYAVQL